MKTIEVVLYGIDLTIDIEQKEIDCFDPVSGHYTMPDGWEYGSITHKGEDISELMSDNAWFQIEQKVVELLQQGEETW